MPQLSHWIKVPDEVLDYEMDFAGKTNGVAGAVGDYLSPDERITSFTVTAEAGIVVQDAQLTKASTCVYFVLRGGVAGKTYQVTVMVATSESRIVERSYPITLVSKR